MPARAYLVAKAERELAASSKAPRVQVIVRGKDGQQHGGNEAKVAVLTGLGLLAGQRLVGAAAGKAVNEAWTAGKKALRGAPARKPSPTRHKQLLKLRRTGS